ncbi:MAG: winged helix-turn-helix transcriptional regulator [Thermoplasmatota archaeon]
MALGVLSSRPIVPSPVAETAKVIGKKWYLIILHELHQGARGFNELKRAVQGISAKVLSESLSELEARGLVQRRVASESPIRVEYRLTAKGEDLSGLFDIMRRWGEKWAETGASEAFHAPTPALANPPTSLSMAGSTPTGSFGNSAGPMG